MQREHARIDAARIGLEQGALIGRRALQDGLRDVPEPEQPGSLVLFQRELPK